MFLEKELAPSATLHNSQLLSYLLFLYHPHPEYVSLIGKKMI
jgi:hypothetical protein